MNPEQEKKLNEVYDFMNTMKNSASIPQDVDSALRDRLRDISGLSVSAKDLNSEDQSVNEGGAGTYSVLGDPDGFLQVVVSGITYYLPYYD